jgi:hypothetical protein
VSSVAIKETKPPLGVQRYGMILPELVELVAAVIVREVEQPPPCEVAEGARQARPCVVPVPMQSSGVPVDGAMM